ncbi:hypothetical protein BVRB_024440 [Beta vulgaris subsp. vulgaris]|uniref:Uncharacterized protein n=1 Tax=Beta vulgaris subsp. vulgaris TaxID=3555 RepID=A0A0J8AZJ0_BETVV|nr:hypothetical protein BVRB_024440 [Beta vulgaris subsp. vulgaris]
MVDVKDRLRAVSYSRSSLATDLASVEKNQCRADHTTKTCVRILDFGGGPPRPSHRTNDLNQKWL